MCKVQWLLAVLALHVGVAYSWDIAVGVGNQLIFYDEGYKTNTVRLKHQNLGALAYDGIHNMMLYVDKLDNNDTICGYDISSEKIECYIKRNGRNIHSLAYDPTTEILFFTDVNERSINWISLKRGSNNNIYGNLLIKMDDRTPTDIIVDSCEGNIYWINTNIPKSHYKETMETARFDGSKRKRYSRTRYDFATFFPDLSLTMDTQNRAIYYFNDCEYPCSTIFLKVSYFDGKPGDTVYSNSMRVPKELTVSKENLYWMSRDTYETTLWKLPKTSRYYEHYPEEISTFTESTLSIAANYEIDDHFRRIQDCDSVLSDIPTITVAPVSACENYCMRGNCSVNDQGLPKCSCNAGYSGERCEVSACLGFCLNNGNCSLNEDSKPVCQCKGEHSGDRCEVSDCQNYCIQGDCHLNDVGLPTCSCNAGYSGERCEVSACLGFCLNNGNCSLNEDSKPVCQCKGEHSGVRCEVSDCQNYCIQGDCRLNDDGLPKCSCNAGYSGERCEVSACHGFCLNNGECSLNENSKPVCQCKGGHSGDRCEVSDCQNYCIQGDCHLNDVGLPTCSCNTGYSGERCEVSACHGFCLNNGNCSLNEYSKPVCQCKEEHSGDRCEVSDCQNYCIQGDCRLNDDGHRTCSCNAGYSGERCEVSACHGFCLNDGACSLNEEEKPVCQCVSNYEGSRCEVDVNNTCTFTNTSMYSAQKNLTLFDLLSNWRKPTAKISVTVEV